MTILYATLAVVVLQRLLELAWAGRNTARLRRRGGVEIDAAGYPLFILLHAGWIASLALFVPGSALPQWPLLGLFAFLQSIRIWVILSLGTYWTTRIVTLPGVPLVRTGPFRWLRHPNYMLVGAEIVLLPLAFGAVAIAAVFSALNLLLTARRIRIEDRALMPRRPL